MTDAFDRQVAGNHYKDFAIQPGKFAIENELTFAQGNIVKYICRYDRPGRTQRMDDLRKAEHYIQMLIEKELTVDPILKCERIRHAKDDQYRVSKNFKAFSELSDIDISEEVDDPKIAAQIRQASGCEDGSCEV
jgi:hypothetical protein